MNMSYFSALINKGGKEMWDTEECIKLTALLTSVECPLFSPNSNCLTIYTYILASDLNLDYDHSLARIAYVLTE